MKQKTKIILVVCISILIIGLLILVVIPFPEKIDCNSYGAIYLKQSELSSASEIADALSVVVVVTELNQSNFIIARTEILECDSFDYNRYIDSPI